MANEGPTRFVGRTLVIASLALALVVAGSPATSGATSATRVRLITRADLAGSWKVVKVPSPSASSSGSCPSVSRHLFTNRTVHSATFTQGPAIPSLTELVVTGDHLGAAWTTFRTGLAACTHPRVKIGSTYSTLHESPLTFGAVSESSDAVAYRFTTSGLSFVTDDVAFYTGSAVVVVDYSDLGTPSIKIVRAMVSAALDRLSGKTVHVVDDLTVTSVPKRTIHTARGWVQYRAYGSGPPLVLIMGYAGPMESWDRRFVDALASTHRVVTFDNAGIGKTSPARPLTIDAMANQTSALIAALHLGPVDLVGWSMGGMIAQALAVLHPAQVRALVLMSTYPGAGPVLRPSQAEVNAITNPKSKLASTVLFPKHQGTALSAFELALSSYPTPPTVSSVVVAAQGSAILAWWGDQDPAGRRDSSITVPTLVADGTEDALDPVANDRALARLIPRSELDLYPDAGHAFFSQDWSAASAAIDRFVASAH